MLRQIRFGLLAVVLGVSMSFGQEIPAAAATEAQEQEVEKPWSLSLALDVPTAYFFRGYNLEDSGYIVQPSATFSYTIYSKDDLSITPYVSTWNSFHGTKSPQSPKHWYEADLYGGTKFVHKQWTLDISYLRYMYPGRIAGDTEEIGATLNYDDGELAKSLKLPFALQPYVSYWREISDHNGEQDQSMEVGIRPAFDLGDTKLNLTIPVAVGLSPDGFYTDRNGRNAAFGYATIGATLSHPLPIPEKYGKWTISAGVQYLYLDADSVRAANNGTRSQVIGKISLAAEF